MSDPDSPPRDADLSDVPRVHRERSTSRRRVPDAIQDAYRNAWNGFYTWEPAHSTQILRSLQADLEVLSISSDDLVAHVNVERPSAPVDRMDVDTDTDDPVPQAEYTQWFPTLSASSMPLSADIVSADDAPSTDYAYPKYEACTPAAHSILHDGEIDVLPFVPYADEGKMVKESRLRRFAQPYRAFAWQIEWFDVDCE